MLNSVVYNGDPILNDVHVIIDKICKKRSIMFWIKIMLTREQDLQSIHYKSCRYIIWNTIKIISTGGITFWMQKHNVPKTYVDYWISLYHIHAAHVLFSFKWNKAVVQSLAMRTHIIKSFFQSLSTYVIILCTKEILLTVTCDITKLNRQTLNPDQIIDLFSYIVSDMYFQFVCRNK